MNKNIDNYINSLEDWRGEMLERFRGLVHQAAPDIKEEWKWDTPVFAKEKNILAFGVFKDHVKLNFMNGAKLADPKKLFNSGLEAKNSRAIDLYQGDDLNEEAFKDLVQEASQ